MFPSAASGSPTSCAGSASGPANVAVRAAVAGPRDRSFAVTDASTPLVTSPRAVTAAGGRAFFVGGWVRDGCSACGPRTSTSRSSASRRIVCGAARALRTRATRSARASRSSRLGDIDVVAAAPRIEDRPRPQGIRRRPAIRTMSSPTRRAGATSPSTPSLGSADGRATSTRSTAGPTSSDGCCASSIRRRFARRQPARAAGVQFAARFDLTLDDGDGATVPVDSARRSARRTDLGRDREAAASRRARRSALRSRSSSGSWTACFPEMKALVGCPQEPEWHPEGDVWVHTLLVDRPGARRYRRPAATRSRPASCSARVCHDLGKPPTTALIDGRIRSLEPRGSRGRADARRSSTG